jgi:hypothetical protein
MLHFSDIQDLLVVCCPELDVLLPLAFVCTSLCNIVLGPLLTLICDASDTPISMPSPHECTAATRKLVLDRVKRSVRHLTLTIEVHPNDGPSHQIVHTALGCLNVADVQTEVWKRDRPLGGASHFALVQLPPVPEPLRRELAVHVALRGIEDFVLLSERRYDSPHTNAPRLARADHVDDLVPFDGVGYLAQYYATGSDPPFFMLNKQGRISRPAVPRQLALRVNTHWAPVVSHGGWVVEGGVYHQGGAEEAFLDPAEPTPCPTTNTEWGTVTDGCVLLWRGGRLYLAFDVDPEHVQRCVRTQIRLRICRSVSV